MVTKVKSFNQLFNDYRFALKAIEPPKQFVTASKVLTLLQARDELEEALLRHYDPVGDRPSDSQLLDLLTLAERLHNCAGIMYDTAPMDEWRRTLRPDPEAWWWYLRRPIHPLDRYDWLWSALSIVPLTATASLLLDMSSRLFDGEFLVGSFAVVTQSVLTLLTAGSVLTETGQKAMRVMFDSLRVPSHFRQELKLVLSVMVFLLALFTHSSLPVLSENYLNQGKQALLGQLSTEQTEEVATVSEIPLNNQANLADARFNFSRAIAINPENIEAYYFLGRVFEEMQDFKAARANYQQALAQDFIHAYNALAYLYIRDGELDKAYDLLQEGLQRAYRQNQDNSDSTAEPQDSATSATKEVVDAELLYALNKNLGWLRAKQGRYEEADFALSDAIAAYKILQKERPQTAEVIGGIAYCLYADVLDKQGLPDDALPYWKNCQLTSDGSLAEQDRFLQIASERLSQGERPEGEGPATDSGDSIETAPTETNPTETAPTETE